METITIEREMLKELLKEAYEAGWYGSLELCGVEVEKLEKKAEDKKKVGVNAPEVFNVNWSNGYNVQEITLAPDSLPFFTISAGSSAGSSDNNITWQNVGDG